MKKEKSVKESFIDRIPVAGMRKKKVTLYLEADLAQKFKAASAKIARTQSAIAEELVTEFLRKLS